LITEDGSVPESGAFSDVTIECNSQVYSREIEWSPPQGVIKCPFNRAGTNYVIARYNNIQKTLKVNVHPSEPFALRLSLGTSVDSDIVLKNPSNIDARRISRSLTSSKLIIELLDPFGNIVPRDEPLDCIGTQMPFKDD